MNEQLISGKSKRTICRRLPRSWAGAPGGTAVQRVDTGWRTRSWPDLSPRVWTPSPGLADPELAESVPRGVDGQPGPAGRRTWIASCHELIASSALRIDT